MPLVDVTALSVVVVVRKFLWYCSIHDSNTPRLLPEPWQNLHRIELTPGCCLQSTRGISLPVASSTCNELSLYQTLEATHRLGSCASATAGARPNPALSLPTLGRLGRAISACWACELLGMRCVVCPEPVPVEGKAIDTAAKKTCATAIAIHEQN
jgi:hypothetical protein